MPVIIHMLTRTIGDQWIIYIEFRILSKYELWFRWEDRGRILWAVDTHTCIHMNSLMQVQFDHIWSIIQLCKWLKKNHQLILTKSVTSDQQYGSIREDHTQTHDQLCMITRMKSTIIHDDSLANYPRLITSSRRHHLWLWYLQPTGDTAFLH